NGATSGQVIQWNGSTWVPVTLVLGEVNTASNVGSGAGIYKTKTGVDLKFKTLVEGDNITITEDTDEVVISTPCPCSTNLFQDGVNVRFTSEDSCATI